MLIENDGTSIGASITTAYLGEDGVASLKKI